MLSDMSTERHCVCVVAAQDVAAVTRLAPLAARRTMGFRARRRANMFFAKLCLGGYGP